MKKKYLLISVFASIYLVLSFSLVFAGEQYIGSGPEQLSELDRVLVDHVYDGDTIRTADGKDVRLIGIDTPEMNWEQGAAEFYAPEAFKYTREKLLDKYVYLEYGLDDKDEYGRKLAYLFLQDGSFFNREILSRGYAGLLLIPPNLKYAKELRKAATEARENSRGIWKKWDQITEKLPVISWQQADLYFNERVIVEGKIKNTHDTGEVVFIDFTKKEDDGLYLVIFANQLYRFDYDPAKFLLGKKIMVTGKIEKYEGLPEIVIESPLQLRIKE